MKAITNSVLAAAVLLALPFASEACTKNAWNGNTSASDGVRAAGWVDTPQLRAYEGLCAAEAGAGQFVTDNTPSAEATYQALFYVYTSGTGKVFTATTAQSNGGTEAVGVSYNGTAFTFSGVSGVSAIPAVASRWYAVRLTYQSGGAFSVAVRGNGSDTVATGSGTAPSATIESASLGLIGTGTAAFVFDGFQSTRSTTPIPFLCKGDTNGDGSRTIVDAGRQRNHFLSGGSTPAGGQPDVNEDGFVTIVDAGLTRNIFLAGQAACPTT